MENTVTMVTDQKSYTQYYLLPGGLNDIAQNI